MTTSDLNKLRTAAEEALRLNDNDVKKAAPKLARVLMENSKRPLLIALVADYLSRLPPSEAAADDEAPKRKTKPKAQPHSRRRQGKHRRTKALGTPSPQQPAPRQRRRPAPLPMPLADCPARPAAHRRRHAAMTARTNFHKGG